jgi:hypothetical protein
MDILVMKVLPLKIMKHYNEIHSIDHKFILTEI